MRDAGTGPTPMIAGSTPATAVETTRASGRRPRDRASSASTTSVAAAPSLIPDEFPAVTDPPSRNAGRSLASASIEVSARGCSSRVTSTGSLFFCGTSTGTIWSSKRPPSIAATARWWDSSANASCRSRVTSRSAPYRSTTFSAVSPIEYGWCIADSRGLMNRQPSVVSWRCVAPRSQAASAFPSTNGARVIDSTPPARNTSPSPTAIAFAAALIACRPEPHRRFTV